MIGNNTSGSGEVSKGLIVLFILICTGWVIPYSCSAGTAAEIDEKVQTVLPVLYSTSEAAGELSKTAKGILVFPSVVKAGFGIGGQYGEGALMVDGKTNQYFSTVAMSYGLQAGAQKFGYAMFLMTDEAVKYLKSSDGWELGTGPSIVVMDEGKAASATTSSLKQDIYVFFFGQKGLMAGLGIQGTKVTPFEPKK